MTTKILVKRGPRANLSRDDNGSLMVTTDSREIWLGQGGGTDPLCLSRPKRRIVNGSWGSTINIDGTALDFVRVVITGDCTINITGTEDGEKLILDLKQDGTGGHTVTLGTGFKFGTDITSYVNSTGVNKTDHLGLIYNAADAAYHVIAVSHGF